MSLNHFINQSHENKTLNPRFNSLMLNNGLDMKNSNIVDVKNINGIPFGNISLKPSSEIIYRQGNGAHVPLSNVYGTWSEVQSVITATEGALIIYIDDTKGVPLIDSNTNFQSRCKIMGYPTQNRPNLKIQDGVVLSNLAYIEGVALVGSFTSIVPLQFSQGFVLALFGNASLKFDAVSSKPFFELSGSQGIVISSLYSSSLDNSLSPLTPIVNLTGSNQLILVGSNGASYNNDIVTGGPSSTLIFISDASINLPTNSGMTGTINPIKTDHACGVYYSDSAPLLNASCVQQAITALKSSNNIGYTDTAPLIGSNNVQGALDLVKSASVINYDDFLVNPQLGYDKVQGAIDGLKSIFAKNAYYDALLVSATFNVPNNLNTLINAWVAGFSNPGITFNSNTSFTINADYGGVYLITYNISWPAVALGSREAWIEINSNSLPQYAYSSVNNVLALTPIGISGSIQLRLLAGDIITLIVKQTCGLPIVINNGYISISQVFYN